LSRFILIRFKTFRVLFIFKVTFVAENFKDFMVMVRRLLTEALSRLGCELSAADFFVENQGLIPVEMVEHASIGRFSYRIHIDGVASVEDREFGFFFVFIVSSLKVEVEIYDVYDAKYGRDIPLEEEKVLKEALGLFASQLEKWGSG